MARKNRTKPSGIVKITLENEWYQKLLEMCKKTGLRKGELARSLVVQNLQKKRWGK